MYAVINVEDGHIYVHISIYTYVTWGVSEKLVLVQPRHRSVHFWRHTFVLTWESFALKHLKVTIIFYYFNSFKCSVLNCNSAPEWIWRSHRYSQIGLIWTDRVFFSEAHKLCRMKENICIGEIALVFVFKSSNLPNSMWDELHVCQLIYVAKPNHIFLPAFSFLCGDSHPSLLRLLSQQPLAHLRAHTGSCVA